MLLDEPTVGVDPQSRERIYEMLARLRQHGVSIVLTTHHLEEAEQRCERIVIIDHGQDRRGRHARRAAATTLGDARTLQDHAGVAMAGRSRAARQACDVDDARRVSACRCGSVGRDVARRARRQSPAPAREVADVDLAGATLQDVFIALTGRELRE